MRYLLDTDVISQLTKPRPHDAVKWVLAQEESRLFLSVMTLMEIRIGIEMTDLGRRRDTFEEWLINDLPKRFAGRIVPVEQHVADLAGRIIHQARKSKLGTDEVDAIIAATAIANDMELATLNRKHFEKLPVKLVQL